MPSVLSVESVMSVLSVQSVLSVLPVLSALSVLSVRQRSQYQFYLFCNARFCPFNSLRSYSRVSDAGLKAVVIRQGLHISVLWKTAVTQ